MAFEEVVEKVWTPSVTNGRFVRHIVTLQPGRTPRERGYLRLKRDA